MSETTYYQRNREVILKRAKNYYENNKKLDGKERGQKIKTENYLKKKKITFNCYHTKAVPSLNLSKWPDTAARLINHFHMLTLVTSFLSSITILEKKKD